MVVLEAGQRVRPPRPVARRHPRRPPPSRRPRRLRRRLLEPARAPRRLLLLHGRAHRHPLLPRRLRLRRHRSRRVLRRPRPRLPRVPPRRLLRLAPSLRPRPVAGDPPLFKSVRALQGDRPGPAVPHRRSVLPHRTLPSPVRLLQATGGVRIRVREPDAVGEPDRAGGELGLPDVAQRGRPPLLRLRLLQGRVAGEPPIRVAQGGSRPRRHRRPPRLGLRLRLLRLQHRPEVSSSFLSAALWFFVASINKIRILSNGAEVFISLFCVVGLDKICSFKMALGFKAFCI